MKNNDEKNESGPTGSSCADSERAMGLSRGTLHVRNNGRIGTADTSDAVSDRSADPGRDTYQDRCDPSIESTPDETGFGAPPAHCSREYNAPRADLQEKSRRDANIPAHQRQVVAGYSVFCGACRRFTRNGGGCPGTTVSNPTKRPLCHVDKTTGRMEWPYELAGDGSVKVIAGQEKFWGDAA